MLGLRGPDEWNRGRTALHAACWRCIAPRDRIAKPIRACSISPPRFARSGLDAGRRGARGAAFGAARAEVGTAARSTPVVAALWLLDSRRARDPRHCRSLPVVRRAGGAHARRGGAHHWLRPLPLRGSVLGTAGDQ